MKMQISLCLCSLVDVMAVNCFDSMYNTCYILVLRLKLVTVAVHVLPGHKPCTCIQIFDDMAEMEHIWASSRENLSSGYATK